MKNLGYYNGKYGLLEEMSIPMNDRVCWFGDGVYDAGPCRNYKIFAMDEHVDRFFRSAAAVDIEIPMSKDELKALLNELVLKLDTGDLFVYYQVTRGTQERNHCYEKGPGNLWVLMRPATIQDGRTPISVITAEDTRFLHCNVKSLNLIPSVIASQKAKEQGCQETIFYRAGGRVTECAHSNVHILKDGVFHTAPTDNLILAGIARAHMIAACKREGIPVVEEPFYLPELYDADEIIVTSSSNLCMRVAKLDGKPAGFKDEATFEKIRRAVLDEFTTFTDI